MIRSDRRFWPLATGLAMLAGYVDAIGFQHFGGYFVSFMSGNATMLAIRLVAPDGHGSGAVSILAMLLGLFVGGVMLGTLIRLGLPKRGQVIVLLAVAGLLTMAAGWSGWGALAMVIAMGALNATFERGGEVSIGVTYMTGTLVKIGQHLARAVMGRTRWAWLPYLGLWVGFVAGVALGAWAFSIWGMAALAAAAGAAVVGAGVSWALQRAV